jgi:hypothetical protein
MKYIIVIIVITFFSQTIKSQLVDSNYSFEIKEYNTYCNLTLSKEGTYFISISQKMTPGIVKEYIISHGKTFNSKNCITLKDQTSKIEMILQKSDSDLVVIKGYYFLVGIKLTFESHHIDNLIGELNDSYLHNCDINYMVINEPYMPEKSLSLGSYTFEDKYTLSFHANNKYELQLNDLLLLKGTFSRWHNELILWDESLGWHFILLIDQQSLRSINIPGCAWGSYFYRKSMQVAT